MLAVRDVLVGLLNAQVQVQTCLHVPQCLVQTNYTNLVAFSVFPLLTHVWKGYAEIWQPSFMFLVPLRTNTSHHLGR